MEIDDMSLMKYSMIFIDVLSNQPEEFLLYPIYVLGADDWTLIRVYPGKPMINANDYKPQPNELGIWIDSREYDLIDHHKGYIFFHEMNTIEMRDQYPEEFKEVISNYEEDRQSHFHIHLSTTKCEGENIIFSNLDKGDK